LVKPCAILDPDGNRVIDSNTVDRIERDLRVRPADDCGIRGAVKQKQAHAFGEVRSSEGAQSCGISWLRGNRVDPRRQVGEVDVEVAAEEHEWSGFFASFHIYCVDEIRITCNKPGHGEGGQKGFQSVHYCLCKRQTFRRVKCDERWLDASWRKSLLSAKSRPERNVVQHTAIRSGNICRLILIPCT
jgi:hypothetical protein